MSDDGGGHFGHCWTCQPPDAAATAVLMCQGGPGHRGDGGSHFGHPWTSVFVIIGCVEVAWVVGVEVRWWPHWLLSSSSNLFHICRISNQLVENRKIVKKIYHWQGLERQHVSSPYTSPSLSGPPVAVVGY